MKRWISLVAAVVVLVLAVFGVKAYLVKQSIQKFLSAAPPKITVTTITAVEQDWQAQLRAIGSLRAVRGADLSTELSGIVESIDFESGADVKSGAEILRLRADTERAQLDSLKATANLAEITYQRDQGQFAAHAISQEQLDTDAANLHSARAQVAQQQAQLDKKLIHAPFSGRLGIRQVDIGQYLNPGDKIVTLQTLDPIYIDFTLPQQSLSDLRLGQTVHVQSDAFPGQTYGGEITALNPRIDTETRNLQLRATLKNPQKQLLPGMFVNVAVDSGAPQRYLTLPQTAITYNPYGDTVFIVTHAAPDNKEHAPELGVKQVFVTLGATRGDQVAVLSGIQAGDEVVTSGQLKLNNGSAIVIDNKVTPSNDANPQPQEH